MSKAVEEFMKKIVAKNPGESEFHQAVQEVAESVMPFIDENPKQGLCSLFLVGGSPNTISSGMRLANYNRLYSNRPNGL